MSNIVLREQGDSVAIPQAGMELSEYTSGETKIRVILQWNAEVDLDVHAFFRPKGKVKMAMCLFITKVVRKNHLTFILIKIWA